VKIAIGAKEPPPLRAGETVVHLRIAASPALRNVRICDAGRLARDPLKYAGRSSESIYNMQARRTRRQCRVPRSARTPQDHPGGTWKPRDKTNDHPFAFSYMREERTMKQLRNAAIVAVLFLFVSGCASPQKCVCPQTADSGSRQHLQEGYALLYLLARQEKEVDMILKIRKTSPANRQLIEEIAEVNRNLFHSLETWAQNDPGQTLTCSGLPELEERSVSGIKSQVTWQLLLSGRGESIKRVMLAQHQTLGCETSLLKAIQASERTGERQRVTAEYVEKLENLSARLLDQICIEE
jgi:hypothetical protein